jgi:hypothetical protein
MKKKYEMSGACTMTESEYWTSTNESSKYAITSNERFETEEEMIYNGKVSKMQDEK